MPKFDQEKHNPCLKEQNMTYKCLNDNDYDKEKCELEMENYKICKGFWTYIRTDRRRKGISPYLPPVEDREQIKKEFLSSYKS